MIKVKRKGNKTGTPVSASRITILPIRKTLERDQDRKETWKPGGRSLVDQDNRKRTQELEGRSQSGQGWADRRGLLSGTRTEGRCDPALTFPILPGRGRDRPRKKEETSC